MTEQKKVGWFVTQHDLDEDTAIMPCGHSLQHAYVVQAWSDGSFEVACYTCEVEDNNAK